MVHAGLVRPCYAEGSIIAFRGDHAGTWAETEYATSELVKAHFKVEVTIDEPDIPEVDGWEVTSLTTGLAREVRSIVVDRLTGLRAA